MEKVFIKRTKELKEIRKVYNDIEYVSKNGKLILIEGNAGIGKSALIREFLKDFESSSKVIVADTECNDKENLNPYAPFKDILIKLNAEAIDKKEEDGSSNESVTEEELMVKKKERRKKLKGFISEAGSSWIGLIPFVGGFATAGIDTYKAYKKTFENQIPDNELKSEVDVYKIFETEFRRLAENKTLIIFIDDLQWADASSLNLLFALSKSIRADPFKIMLIATYRPDEVKIGRLKTTEHGDVVTIRHPFADKLNELRNYTKKESHISENDNWLLEIELHEFKFEELIVLINNSFPNNVFNDDFYRDIFKLTNGQPLFLIETLDLLSRDNNILKNESGRYELNEFDLKELPVSVNAVLNEKIERLDENLKKILAYASISGEKFIIQEFDKILKIDEFELFDFLEILNRKYDLLTEEDGITLNGEFLDSYRFSQTLVHRVIYDSMDKSRRRLLHKHIAATIKSIYGDQLESNPKLKSKYNQHMQIARGLIDGKTLLISKIEAKSGQDNEIYETLLEAAANEIKKAEESAKQWADIETLAFAEKALAFLSQIYQKNEETEKLRFEAYYFKWHAYYKSDLGHFPKICDDLAEVADFFENLDIPSSGEYQSRTAMAYTLQYDYKKANEYFYRDWSKQRQLSKETLEYLDDDMIDEFVKEKRYDEACEIYAEWSEKTGGIIDDDDYILSIGIALASHSKDMYLERAERILTEAYMIAEDFNDRYEFTIAAYYNGVVKFKLGKFKEAKYYLEKAKIRYERWKNPNSTYANWEWDDIYTYLEEIDKIIKKQ